VFDEADQMLDKQGFGDNSITIRKYVCGCLMCVCLYVYVPVCVCIVCVLCGYCVVYCVYVCDYRHRVLSCVAACVQGVPQRSSAVV